MADSSDSEESDASGGTYSLLLELGELTTIEVGALGAIPFDAGRYAYTGSALGPGGFARIDRHREVATGERTVRHWHVDYLLGHPATTIDAVWVSPGADRECEIAADLPGDPVPASGASDCDCEAHLLAAPEESAAHTEPIVDALAGLHGRRHEPSSDRD